MTTKSQDSYHHGDLRRALLVATLSLLEEGAEPTLRAVARRAGVSHTAPYHYFADRRALVAAVAEEGLVGLRRALEDAIPGKADPAVGLLESGVAYVRFATANPALYRLMFSSELADRSSLPDLQAAYAGAYGVLLGAMRKVYGPEAPAPAVELAALGAWATVHGLAMLLLENQVAGVAADGEAAEQLTRQVLLGRPPGNPSSVSPAEAGSQHRR